jgi:hypothetical protein
MTEIIALLGIIPLLWELKNFINPSAYDELTTSVSEQLKRGEMRPENSGFIWFNLFYFIWTISGLFTKMWPLFLTLIFLSFLSANFTKIKTDVRQRIIGRRIDALFSVVIISFILFYYFF